MMLQYPFIELFVRSRDIDMMIHAIKLLNNNALKSSLESRKVYYLTLLHKLIRPDKALTKNQLQFTFV